LSGVDSNSNGHSPTTPSACEPFREAIELGLSQGRNAMAIWQDLVADHGFQAGYLSVQRFVRRLRGNQPAQACAVICTPVGEEAQVDYGNKGPMVRDERTGKYRRTRLFVLTLGYSRKAVRLLTFQSSSRIWAELHEKAFRRCKRAASTARPMLPSPTTPHEISGLKNSRSQTPAKHSLLD
jgi:transposase